MKTKIALIIVSVDLTNGTFYTLQGDDWPFVYERAEGEQPIDVVKGEFGLLVGLSPNWANFKVMSAKMIENDLYICYSCIIPYDTLVNLNTKWVPVSSVTHDNFHEELLEATRNIG